jgi:phosphoserine phosphatase
MPTRLALLDWDGTMRPGFTIADWTTFLADRGLLPRSIPGAIERALAQWSSDQASHDDVVRQTADLYASALTGRAESDFLAMSSEFATETEGVRFALADGVFEHLMVHAIHPVVITGAPTEALDTEARLLSNGTVYALEASTRQGVFTGRVRQNPGLLSGKRRIVRSLMRDRDAEIVLAMGNSSSDFPLFAAASAVIVVDNPQLAAGPRAMHVRSDGPVDEIADLLLSLPLTN